MVLDQIFPDLLKKLKAAYYERHKKTISQGIRELVMVMTGNEGRVSAEAQAKARTAEAALIERFGYTAESARDLVTLMARARYPG
jgi:hypothetical protein